MLFQRSARLGVLLVMLPGYVLSQESRPKFPILVEVSDISGAVVVGATIQVHSISAPMKVLAATNEVGEFRIQLEAGKYTVSIMDSGFKTLTQQIEVTDVENQRFGFVLQIGTMCSPCVDVFEGTAIRPSDAVQSGNTDSFLHPSTAGKTSTIIESTVACHDVSNAKPLPPPGPACERELFARRGRPFMFAARAGIAYGVSFNPEKHSELYLWAENRTDQASDYLLFCCEATLLDAIIIYNSARHRVLSKSDELARKALSEGRELVPVCTCSGSVIVPAHTIQLFDSADISADYSLGPGRYIISARNPPGFHLKSDWSDDLPQAPAGLEVSIP
jgi:hypothetical protein